MPAPTYRVIFCPTVVLSSGGADAYWHNFRRLFQDQHVQVPPATSNGTGQSADSRAYYYHLH
jgi:hypothetical protein